MKSQAEKAGVVGKKLTFFCRALELITKSDGREEKRAIEIARSYTSSVATLGYAVCTTGCVRLCLRGLIFLY